jgi:hypothetical protein
MKNLLLGLAAVLAAGASVLVTPATATPVDEIFTLIPKLPAPGDPELFHHELTLPAGTYSVGVVRGAWDAWFYDAEFVAPGYSGPHSSGCAADGLHCAKGWLNIFRVQIGEDPHVPPVSTAQFYWDPQALDFTEAVFETPELALGAATWHTFVVASSSVVAFSIFDEPDLWLDNEGSLTLEVVSGVRAGSSIPEPGSLALVLAALLAAATARRAAPRPVLTKY